MHLPVIMSTFSTLKILLKYIEFFWNSNVQPRKINVYLREQKSLSIPGMPDLQFF